MHKKWMLFGGDCPLRDEAGEGNQGGGNGSGEGQVPVLTADVVKAILGDFQKAIITELDKRTNGINKEVKTNFQKITTDFGQLREKFETFQVPPPHDDGAGHENDEENNGGANGNEGGSGEGARREARGAGNGSNNNNQNQNQNRGNSGGNNQAGGNQQQPPVRQAYKPTPKEQQLERELNALKAAQADRDRASAEQLKQAQKKEVDGLLRSQISKHQYNAPSGQDDFFDLIRPKVVRSEEDGNIYGPDGLSLEEFVAAEYGKREYLHPAKQINGSGNGGNVGSRTSGSIFDDSEIKPGMKSDTLDRAYAAVEAALKSRTR